MLKLKTYQQYILGILTSIALFLIGFSILAISLFSANRHQATGINAIFVPNNINQAE